MRPVWAAEAHRYPTRNVPRTADVVVVGGGLIGVAIGLGLASSGRRPVLIDRHRVAGGASGSNGGLLIPGAPESLPDLIERWGPTVARRIRGAYENGAARLVEWIMDLDLACQWRGEGALRVATSGQEARELAREAALLAEAGCRGSWAEAADLTRWMPGAGDRLPPGLHGALVLPGGGPLHSGLLVTGLAARAADSGLTIVHEAAAHRVTEGPHGALVRTPRGSISTDAVVVATNAWLADLVPGVGAGVTPVRGQVLATQPLPAATVWGAWSLNHGYEYLQQLPDGRIVAGGMRWTANDREVGRSSPAVNDDVQGRILRWLRGMFPHLEVEADRRWAGIMGWTADRLPLVGRVPECQRLSVAGGFNGHGLPAAPFVADIITALVNSDEVPEVALLFDPGRLAAGSEGGV